jgi:hypothetical protein
MKAYTLVYAESGIRHDTRVYWDHALTAVHTAACEQKCPLISQIWLQGRVFNRNWNSMGKRGLEDDYVQWRLKLAVYFFTFIENDDLEELLSRWN